MIRRLLCTCLGAALTVPAPSIAKPPDLPDNPTIPLTPQAIPLPAPALYQLRPTARRTLVGSLLLGIHPLLALLPTEMFLDAPCDHPQPKAEDSDVTCPYLRQQTIDRHACQLADSEIGRDVLDNLERLRKADDLLEVAKELANDGYFAEAMECCDLAGELCPGSPCAERAVDTMIELALGIIWPQTDTEEAAEQQADTGDTEPGVEPMVCGLMKACHLLMSQGMHHQAAELARQAYALDPQRVLADPLIYKMHLLAESPPAGASEASEPPTCPYCPSAGKPIPAIVPEKKKSVTKPTTLLVPPLDCEMTQNDGEVRLCGDCSLGDNVYHLRYHRGCLAIWKTPDAGKTAP